MLQIFLQNDFHVSSTPLGGNRNLGNNSIAFFNTLHLLLVHNNNNKKVCISLYNATMRSPKIHNLCRNSISLQCAKAKTKSTPNHYQSVKNI